MTSCVSISSSIAVGDENRDSSSSTGSGLSISKGVSSEQTEALNCGADSSSKNKFVCFSGTIYLKPPNCLFWQGILHATIL